jgi:hypothetical protein
MTHTQPVPAARPARIPLAELAKQPISPALARLMAPVGKPGKAGGFTSSI